MKKTFIIAALVLPILTSCSPQLSLTEKELVNLIDSYEKKNAQEALIDNSGINQLVVVGSGVSAKVSVQLSSAQRKDVIEQIIAKSNCPVTYSDIVLGGDITTSFDSLPVDLAIANLVSGEGIDVVKSKNGLTLQLMPDSAPTQAASISPSSSTTPHPGEPTSHEPVHPSPIEDTSRLITKSVSLTNVSTAEAAGFLLALVPGSGSIPAEADFADTGDISSGASDSSYSSPSMGGGMGSFASGGYSSGFGGSSSFGSSNTSQGNGISGIKFATRTGQNTIFLYGPEEKVARATQYIRQFDSPRDHIMIEAMVLEVDTQAFDSLKSQITSLANGRWSNVMANFGSTLGGSLSFTNTVGATNPTNYSGVIDFLVSQNVARVITRPYVATLSGKPATVNITSDQYLLVQQSEQGATVTAPSSVSAGVILKIVPTIMGSRGVRLKIDVEESSFGVPGENVAVQVDKNNATTVAQIPSGKSIIIGGLMLNRNTRDESGFPFLRHIPILNLLFSSQSIARRTQEVVAIVTPYIWNPSLKSPFQTPTPLTLDSTPSFLSDFESNISIPKVPGQISPD